MYHLQIEREDEVVHDWYGEVFSDEVNTANKLTIDGDRLKITWALECLDGYEDTEEVMYNRHIYK